MFGNEAAEELHRKLEQAAEETPETQDIRGPQASDLLDTGAPKPGRDRATFQMNLYYEHLGAMPEQIPTTGFTKSLTTGQEPFRRRLRVTQEWKTIEAGWLNKQELAGNVFIENPAGKFRQRNPTPEEQALTNATVIQFGHASCPFDIPPGEVSFVLPNNITKVKIRILPSEEAPQEAEAFVFILPR